MTSILKKTQNRFFGEDLEQAVSKRRDPYLHRLYKNQLHEESVEEISIWQSYVCFRTAVYIQLLIASHIKPFIDSDDR